MFAILIYNTWYDLLKHSIDENNMTSETQKSAAKTTTTTTKATTRGTPPAIPTTTTTTEATVDVLKIPDHWILASATSAFQVEGAWNVSGKYV